MKDESLHGYLPRSSKTSLRLTVPLVIPPSRCHACLVISCEGGRTRARDDGLAERGESGFVLSFGVRITEIAAARSLSSPSELRERGKEREGQVTEVTLGGPARIIVGIIFEILHDMYV